MQRRRLIPQICSLLVTTFLIATNVHSAATIGQKAPDFTLRDTAGKSVSLADFKGKTVVLEWLNPGCPYVRKHYSGGNMQSTQKDAASKGVVWLAINSTDTEHPDYLKPAALQAWMGEQKAAASHTLMDESGKAGQAYAARTTPHMYIVNPQGTLVYAGGIDSIPSASASDIKAATNYIKVALAETAAGKPISAAQTRPYGCSVKYKSAM
ncbi:MAG: thioredoxin family protein [Burkholderiaceae bacterium]